MAAPGRLCFAALLALAFPGCDEAGRVWLSSWTLECYKTTPRYTIIAPDGSWLGVFEPPAGFALLAAAGERVLGVVRDELDVPSVAVYELVGW